MTRNRYYWNFDGVSVAARELYTLQMLADESGTRHTLETESIEQLLSDLLIYVVDPVRHRYALTHAGRQVIHSAQAEGAL